jgi:hypothetical protein
MFKLKKSFKSNRDTTIEGSFVGCIFGNPNNEIRWKILEWNSDSKWYYRSLSSNRDSDMSTLSTYHIYSHNEIVFNIEIGDWILIKEVENV